MGKGSPAGDDLVAAFAAWAADERVGEAARQRSRERWLRQQATEDATLAGVLTDLAERRAEVAVSTRTQTLAGRLVGVAEDFFVVVERDGTDVLVATRHLASFNLASVSPAVPAGGGGDPSGDRPAPLPMLLVDALGLLAAERSPVRLGLTSGELVSGDLVAVGRDVLTLRGAGGQARAHYVAVAAVETCAPR